MCSDLEREICRAKRAIEIWEAIGLSVPATIDSLLFVLINLWKSRI